MKVAVTGASGFIGRNLLSKLINLNFDINVLDADGSLYPKGVKVFSGNLLTGEKIDSFLEGSDILIHLAGQVLPGKTSMEDGNVKTTENLILRAMKKTVKKIIFSSSIAVYGDLDNKVFKETDECDPNTEYGQSKLTAEKIINKWSEKTEGKAVIFRFFSVYGPENRKGVVFNFCKDFIEKSKVSIFGNGLQKRDLVYVDDVTELLKLSVTRDLSGIYNVGSGKYYSIFDLISILEDIGGKKCEMDFKEVEKGKVNEILYSVDKLKSSFGWTPKVDIKEGVKRVYEYLLKNER